MMDWNPHYVPEEPLGYWEWRYHFPGLSSERVFRKMAWLRLRPRAPVNEDE